jgi:hypothetical protein
MRKTLWFIPNTLADRVPGVEFNVASIVFPLLVAYELDVVDDELQLVPENA